MVFCSGQCVESGQSKKKFFVRRSPDNQRVIASEQFSNVERERFWLVVIAGNDIKCDATYHFVEVRVLFHHRQFEMQNHSSMVRYLDVVKPLDSTKDLLGRLCFRWSTENDVERSGLNVISNRMKPPAP